MVKQPKNKIKWTFFEKQMRILVKASTDHCNHCPLYKHYLCYCFSKIKKAKNFPFNIRAEILPIIQSKWRSIYFYNFIQLFRSLKFKIFLSFWCPSHNFLCILVYSLIKLSTEIFWRRWNKTQLNFNLYGHCFCKEFLKTLSFFSFTLD